VGQADDYSRLTAHAPQKSDIGGALNEKGELVFIVVFYHIGELEEIHLIKAEHVPELIGRVREIVFPAYAGAVHDERVSVVPVVRP
jgi:hypothetical protein